jgi:hypothetical protein
VTGFYVDVRGLDSVYNLLVRASDDARDIYRYAQRYCQMSMVQQGILLNMQGPHANAYRRITEALAHLADLAQVAATQVNQAQLRYARADLDALARLDASYPGAVDPTAVRSTLSQGRPDLRPARSALSGATEPTLHLKPPNYLSEITTYQLDPYLDLLSPTAWIRQACFSVLGHDPLEFWCTQVSGDWDAFVYVSIAWAHVGAATEDVGRSLIAGAAGVASVWRGNAAEAEQEYQLRLGEAIMALGPACREYSERYMEAAEAARNFFPPASDLVAQFLDLVILAHLSAAAGTLLIETGIGAIAGFAVAAFYVSRAIEVYQQISSAYSRLEDSIRTLAAIVDTIQAGQEVATVPALEPYRGPADR